MHIGKASHGPFHTCTGVKPAGSCRPSLERPRGTVSGDVHQRNEAWRRIQSLKAILRTFEEFWLCGLLLIVQMLPWDLVPDSASAWSARVKGAYAMNPTWTSDPPYLAAMSSSSPPQPQ